MKRITINPLTDQRWQSLIESQPSSIFHTPGWLRVLSDTYGFDVKANIIVDQDENDEGKREPVAGLPYCDIVDFRGRRISALPFSDYTDPLVQKAEHWDHLVTPLCDNVTPFKIRPLHNRIPLSDERFEEVNRARWHKLDLTPTVDDLWMQIDGSVRTSIRKARKNNLSIRHATSESDLEAFFQLHVGVRKRKYRMVAQPYQFFQNIWNELIVPGNGKLLVASYNDEIVAASIFLHWQGTLYYKFNASNPDMLWLNPNEPLLWEGIQYGKSIGCHELDFGLSDWDQDGLIYFKRKFADVEKPIFFLQTRLTSTPSLDSQDVKRTDIGALLPQLTELFTDESVPQRVTADAGALLYRYFA